MEYYFQDYVFKSDQLTLLKQGELIKLRVNEAKLLALLLSNPDFVFSKEDIFSEVWSGKVVTEQAIFQNISRLRNIFDKHAIINHPKKGYQ
jgi:DNA-binding winged helix-turn-helix (wHTH) protein|tara:strand:- start:14 stop:286 length:273 start_codon:yes stop_codon:yes gene_type:complete